MKLLFVKTFSILVTIMVILLPLIMSLSVSAKVTVPLPEIATENADPAQLPLQDPELMPGCSITGCCNANCSMVRVCCMHWTCLRWTWLPICPEWPPCCLEWGPGYFCDCYPSHALPQYVEECE